MNFEWTVGTTTK